MLQPKPKFTPPSDAVVVESESSFVPPSDAIEIKKKEPAESTSTTPEKNLESVQKVGSSDIIGSNGFPAIDVNLGVPGLKPDLKTVEQLANPPKSKAAIRAEQNNALKYEKFKQFSALSDERKKENAQKAEDEANGVGFLNNITSFGKEVYNTAIEGMSNAPIFAGLKQLKANTEPLGEEKKEAKDLMIKQGVNPKDINYNTVLELAKKIKVQKLNDSDIESRKKDFLSDTEIDFGDLQKGASLELSKISDRDKELLKQKAMLEPALKDGNDRLTELNQQLANFKKNNQQPTAEFVDEYNYAIKYYNDIIKDIEKTDNQFAENRDKIGDLKTNLDLFKRQYGKINNFASNLGATALDLTAGGFGIIDYGFNAAYGALGVDTGPKENSEIVTGLRGISKKIRDRIAKPINVENIEDIGDFGDWMANTVIANQIPIYALIATGPGGIAALGGSSLGTKYGDMVQEMNPDNPVEGQILKNYSNAELALKPVGFGIAETASALVTSHIMKGAARVLASATEPERRLISQTIARKLLDVGKQTTKGGIYESTDEMATQGVQNLIDEKPFTEGMKDAGAAGGAMGVLIPFFGGSIAVAAKPFSIDNKIQNSAKRTLALEKELANPNLSEDAKKIIQTNFEESKKTTEDLLKKQVKDISKMSNENFQEILKIENEQAKLKEKAIEIKTQEGLSKDIKKQLLSGFSDRFNQIEVDRLDILSGKKTMPKIEEDSRPGLGNIEEKNGTFYITDEKGITKGFATKEEAQAELETLKLEQSELGLQGETVTTTQPQELAIPDWLRGEYDSRLKEYDEDIADAKKSLEEEKAKGFFSRSKSEIKYYEDSVKFNEDRAKLLKENPIEFYKSELKGVKKNHEERLNDESTYKQDLIDRFGTTDFDVTYSDFIENTNRKIKDYEIVQKTANENAQIKAKEVKQPAQVATTNEQKVAQLRADEQVENAEIEKRRQEELKKWGVDKKLIAEDYVKADYEGKLQNQQEINAQYDAELAETYNKYDKLITPLLETESKKPSEKQETSPEQKVAEIEKRRVETESKIKRKDLFTGVGEFSTALGNSDKDAVPVSHNETNGIEFVEYAHPDTGSVDVIVSGKSDNDFVGFYRIYENGKPTNKWSSKFENKSRNKEDFKTMISGVQELLPEGHQYTEKTSISTDGLRVWNQQLDKGYELQYDENGNIVTNTVAINGDAIVNELGVDVNKGNFENIKITKEQFETVKKALLPYLEKLGLNESNIRYAGEKITAPGAKASVQIDLPVLIKSAKGKTETKPTSTKIGDVVADDVVEKPTTTTKDSTADKFEKSLTLLKEINAKQGVDARNVKRERNEFLKDNPNIKYIDDNYKNIVKQLEKQGLFKQLKDC